MNKDKIMKILENDYNELYNQYGEQIFGVFNYGKNNYNININNEKEIYVIAFYIPTIDDLYYNKTKHQDIQINNHLVTLLDIRELEGMIEQQDLCIFELLSISNFIINKKYNILFNEIKNNKYNLFIDKKKIVTNFEHDYFYYKNIKKDILMAVRLSISCELYVQGETFEDCIGFKKEYLRQYLNSISNQQIIPNFLEIEQNFIKMKNIVEDLPTQNIKQIKELIHVIILNIIKTASIEDISNTEFLSLLTKMEQTTFNIILQEIQYNEGNISISQLIDKHNISRPVFKNTIQKMKDNKIAEIENMGAKGTYIKIINSNYLK